MKSSCVQTTSKPLATGGPSNRMLTPLPRPGSRPSPKHHHRCQHFGFGAEAAEGPQVTVEPGPLTQSLATPLLTDTTGHRVLSRTVICRAGLRVLLLTEVELLFRRYLVDRRAAL